MDWSRFTPPASWKQSSDGEWHGPCQVTGEGANCAFLNVRDRQPPNCRKCGDPATGRLTGADLEAHARPLGIWTDAEIDLSGDWIWTTADGRTRGQYRAKDGAKRWRTKDDAGQPFGDAGRGDGPLAPGRLLYFPPGAPPLDPARPIIVCEGASSTDHARRHGLQAIGHTGSTCAESLQRDSLPRDGRYCIWADADAAGERQAGRVAGEMRAAGLTVAVLEPRVLFGGDVPDKADAGDWRPGDDPEAEIVAAVRPAGAEPAEPGRAQASPPAAGRWEPPSDGLPIPRHFTELCDSPQGLNIMIAARSGGRLRYVHESGQWLFFTDRDGWRPVKTATVEEHLADCARANVGSVDKNGDCRMRPGSSGSKTFAHNVARLLHGRSEIVTHEADWDSERNIVCLPSGALLDVLTGERRRPTVGALHARRVRVEPASAADFAASRFCQVLQHAIPSHAERNYLQRRLGAALADAEGLDDLIWLYGSPGCGKSTLLEGVKQTLGDYAGGVPINELLRGVNKGHSAWLARLAGCRLLYTDDVPVGHYLDDGTINRLLGSGITAQHMRLAPFDFRLQAPLVCTSNAPPQITSTNVRRLRPIKCGPSVPDPDPDVRAAMSSEREIAACLRWLLDGAAAWRVRGCRVPASVAERANEAAAASPIAEFTATFGPGERIEPRAAFRRWQDFKRESGGRPGSEKALISNLQAAGWRKGASNGRRYVEAPAVTGSDGLVIESYAHDARANQDDIQSTENPSLPVTAPEIFPINIGETEPAPIPPEQDTALSGGDEIAPTALEDQAAGGGTTAPLISDPQPPAAPPTDAAVRHVADWIAETTTDRDGPLAELIAAVADDADAADDSAACEHLARRLLRATTFPPPPLPDAPAACDVPAAFLERCGAIGAAVLSQRSPVGTLRTLQREVGIDRTGFDWTGDGQIRSDVPPEHRDRLRPEIRRTVDAFCTMAAEVRHGDVT